MPLTIKQRKAGAVNVYAINMTVYVHAVNSAHAESYMKTAIKDWAGDGKLIGATEVHDVQESAIRFYGPAIYPEEVEE